MRSARAANHGKGPARERALRRARLLLLLSLLLAACDSSPPSAPEVPPFDPLLSETALLDHLNFLAADSLFGRGVGSEHERRAAEYVRDRFQEHGLQPGDTTYLQTVPLPFPVNGQTGATSQNVLGVLPGEGRLAGQWLILGAHYDHLGFLRASADSVVVYNGADDNASGTALMLEVASYLSDQLAGVRAVDGRRSIMFQAYGAEEAGLIGSDYFCEHPTVPMDSVVAMLNLDMVGRLRDNVLILVGTSSSDEWTGLVAAANGTSSLWFALDERLLGRSDQACFYHSQRPVLFLHTGLHNEYHTPYDDVWLINTDGMLRVGNLVIALLQDLAVRSERLSFGDVALEFAEQR
jgi:hypothetical protein